MSYAYYRFFPGDYMRDTMHLGWYEDLAYRRLIDLYNMTGKPIRNDRSYILRAVRAFEPEQQQSVDNVLQEFFVLKADGWHQIRCDAEVKYRRGSSEGGKRASNARWHREHVNKVLDTPALPAQSVCITNQNQNQNHKKKRHTIPLPDGFGISARVRSWAERKGHSRLETHLEHFLGYARAHAACYADWDEAFMNCIRGNWAKLDRPAERKLAI